MPDPIQWPALLLPRPQRNFNFSVSNSTLRTKFDSGRTRQRKRFTKDFRTISVAWSFNDDEFYYFESFVKETLSNGQEWFEMELIQGDGFKTFYVRIVGGVYKATYDEVMYWNVTATLELEDPAALTAEELAALALLGDDLDPPFASLDAYHNVINSFFPANF